MPVHRPKSGLPPVEKLPPELKEFTIRVGDADLYVNLDRHLDVDDQHVLYEAVLSDQHGSRLIYVDREELAACLVDSPILTPPASLPERGREGSEAPASP